jgi:hypothetical protein
MSAEELQRQIARPSGVLDPATMSDSDLHTLRDELRRRSSQLTGCSSDFNHRIVDELERCQPHAQRVVVPAASHTVPGENPQFYGDVVIAFLAHY